MAVMAAYFLTHATTEAKMATRSFYQSDALNLAEAGIDEAMLDINNANVGTATGWRAATDNSASWVKTIAGSGTSDYEFGQGTGNIYIRIDNWTANTAAVVTVTSVGQVTVPRSAAINRQVIVKVNKRSSAGAGLLSKGGITFNGNVAIDAYNSSLGVPNATTNRTDQVTVATVSSVATLSAGGNSTVYGYVATGGAQPVVGTNGRIYGSTTAPGVKVDPTHVRTDFTQNIPDPTAPTGTSINIGAISSNLTLPRVGDAVQANGRYLYTDNFGGLQLNGNTTLTITGPVDIILRADMQMGGNGKILLSSVNGSSPSMNLYAYGGVQFDGNGLANSTDVPGNAHVYALSNHDVQLNGNATFTGIVYAPNSAIQSNGNGAINGALTGNTINFNGNASLHYDTQLAGGTASPYYAVKSWVELTDTSTGVSSFKHDNRDPFTFL
jgi:hypothetical protein